MNERKSRQFIAIAITVMFSVSAIDLGAQLATLLPQMKPFASPIAAVDVKQAETKPDIYYIVLEDYANAATLKDIYKYDNSPFLDYLAANGFTVKPDQYSNYPYTESSLPATLQMNYLTDVAKNFQNSKPSSLPMRAIFDNPPIVQALKKQGYRYLHLGSWWTDTRKIPAADVNYTEPFKLYAFGLQKTLSEFEYGILSKSVLFRFLTNGLTIFGYHVVSLAPLDIPKILDYQLATINDLAKAPQQGGRFIFVHIMSPHPPYTFNADGSTALYGPGLDDQGAPVEQKYVNALRYTNKQAQEAIDAIRKGSKRPPVIILESDEGPHPREMGEGELTEDFDLSSLTPQKLRQKYGILAAYSLPGASPVTMERLDSPVNTFRVVLDQYFGYNLANLPVCSFASQNAKHVYDFVDVTPKLTGSPNSTCSKIHK